MMGGDRLSNRMSVFSRLARGWNRHAGLGRTVYMKLCFFLQEAYGVPLGYDFTLYSYGPFDSDVLSDLQTAEQFNILKSKMVTYPGGYGFEYEAAADSSTAETYASQFLKSYGDKIDEVLRGFNGLSAVQLELQSTVFFVHRIEGAMLDEQLVARVASIKPHFSAIEIRRAIERLKTLSLVESS